MIRKIQLLENKKTLLRFKTLFFCFIGFLVSASALGETNSAYYAGVNIDDPKYDSNLKFSIETGEFEPALYGLNLEIMGLAKLDDLSDINMVPVLIHNGGKKPIVANSVIEYRLRTSEDKEYAMLSLFATTIQSINDFDEGKIIAELLFGLVQPKSIRYINPDEMLVSLFEFPKGLSVNEINSFVMLLSDSTRVVLKPVPKSEYLRIASELFDIELNAEIPMNTLTLDEDEQNIRSLIAEIQAEEDADRRQALSDQFSQLKENYVGLIARKVLNEWRYQGAEDFWGCDVHIIQSTLGEVLAVNVQNCTIDNSDKARSFKNSIERAVYKASPLPLAPDHDLFDTDIMFQFRVN